MPEGPVYDPGTRRAPAQPAIPGAGSYGAGASGSGFEYDEATLRELMHEWNDLANEFADDLLRATALQRVEGPGIEYASSGNAEQIKASGNALHETLLAREQYCRAMAEKFKTALGKYATGEDTHTTGITQTGGSL